jgi:hypothetical protein
MAVDITIQETIDLVDITVTPNIIEVNVTRTSGGGGGIPTLQEVLDNNNDLVDGNFFAGTGAGDTNTGTSAIGIGESAASGNSGIHLNAFGEVAGLSNSGNDVNALGALACQFNEGTSVNAFGVNSGLGNTFNNVNLFGESATADEDGQTVLSKDGTIMARISTAELTDSRKYTLQDADGTIAFLSDITGATPTLQEVTDGLGNNITTNPIQIEDGLFKTLITPYEYQVINGNDSDAIGLSYSGLARINNDTGTLFTQFLIFDNPSTNGTLAIPNKTGTLATVEDIPTLTSQLTNDGADGVNPFITALDIPVAGEASTLVREVKNMTGATLTKGTVVYISGANGNKALVQKALATTDALSARTFGLLQSDILNNGLGNCVIIGDLSGINTSAFAEGAQLYLSGVTAGAFTDTRVLAPTHLVYVGKVTRVHPTQGQIEVQIQNGYELEEIHDVSITSVTNNQALVYETSSELWKNKTIIEDSISNGVTTIAPSQNAVFDLFQFTRRLIANGTGSVTGTVAETILTSLTIPANTLDTKCFIWSTMDYFKTSPNACTLRLYINTSNSLSGATFVGNANVGSARNVSFNRKLYLNGTTLDFLSGIVGVSNEFVEGLFGASTTTTVNPANDIFLIYTTQNDAVGTVATNKMATVQKLKLN